MTDLEIAKRFAESLWTPDNDEESDAIRRVLRSLLQPAEVSEEMQALKTWALIDSPSRLRDGSGYDRARADVRRMLFSGVQAVEPETNEARISPSPASLLSDSSITQERCAFTQDGEVCGQPPWDGKDRADIHAPCTNPDNIHKSTPEMLCHSFESETSGVPITKVPLCGFPECGWDDSEDTHGPCIPYPGPEQQRCVCKGLRQSKYCHDLVPVPANKKRVQEKCAQHAEHSQYCETCIAFALAQMRPGEPLPIVMASSNTKHNRGHVTGPRCEVSATNYLCTTEQAQAADDAVRSAIKAIGERSVTITPEQIADFIRDEWNAPQRDLTAGEIYRSEAENDLLNRLAAKFGITVTKESK
jgi:hypothetical protein